MKSLLTSLWGYIAAGGAFLLTFFMYKNEKNKRKQAETERNIANSNVDLLEKREKIITDLDILREKDEKKAAEMSVKQTTQLERLKYEDDDQTDGAKTLACAGDVCEI